MRMLEGVGFVIFLIGAAVYAMFIRPALSKEDRKDYYVSALGHHYRGLYFFWDLGAYKRKCLAQGKSLFFWWLEIAVIVLLSLWFFAWIVYFFYLIISGQLFHWLVN